MRKFLIEIQYNGKNYYGFQAIQGKRTVESEIKTALLKLFGKETDIEGCSRTDAGVSAKQYFFDFCADTKLPTERIPFKLNRFLPKDIQAQSAREVPPDFSVRTATAAKTYRYSFYISSHILPLINPTSVRLEKTVDIDAMRLAAKAFEGRHDLTAFKTVENTEKSAVRTIFLSEITTDGNMLYYRIRGDGFLYNTVRIIAGTIKATGEGKMTVRDVYALLEGKALRSANPAITLPPNALILESVDLRFPE